MVAAEKHPGSEQLSDYALGRLTNGEFDEVAEHIDRCEECQDTLSHLELPDDTLVRGLAGEAPEEPFAGEPEFAAALSAMLRGDATAGTDVTEALGGGSTQAIAKGDASLGSLRDYELLAPLGQGGMGVVYRARHTRLDRLVAVKVLPAERMRQAEAIARFHREMKAVGNLDHPNIVRAYDAGEVDGKHFLAMELIDGIDLASLAEREGKLKTADACELVRQAAIGLDYAHRNGLVHRDVKPSNLVLDKSGVVKVLDLGLARLLSEVGGEDVAAGGQSDGSRFQAIGSEITGTDQAMGTPDYMAPEQCSDSRAVDGRSDVYSLGATLYRLLAGDPPYSGAKYNTLAKKIAGLTHDLVPPITSYRTDLPTGLIALIDRMLAKDPRNRIATPGDVAEALAPYCRGSRVRSLAGGAEPLAASAIGPQRWRRWLIAALLGSAIVAAGIVLLRLRTPQGELVVEVDAAVRDAVHVEVSNGDDVKVFSSDAKRSGSDWSVTLAEGKWNVKLADKTDRFTLGPDTVEIKRGGTSLVKVTNKAAQAAIASTAATTAPAEAKPRRPAPKAGAWRLTMPAGFVRMATATKLPGNGDLLQLETGGVLSGDYRWDGHRLYVTQPTDVRFRGLAWEWASGDNEHELVLVAEPSDHPAGPSYLGAKLVFLGDEAPAHTTEARIVRSFKPGVDTPISSYGVAVQKAEHDGETSNEGWSFTATETKTFELFEIKNPDVLDGILKFQATMKTIDVTDQAYLELICKPAGGEELVARGYHQAAAGTTPWTACETPLLLSDIARAEYVRLNLVIEGGGSASLKDVSLSVAPLPSAQGRP